MTVEYESDKPFFSRARTKRAIRSIGLSIVDSSAGGLALYAGAGITIDRSGLAWHSMLDGLLKPYVPTDSERDNLYKEHGLLGLATLAVEYYKQDYGELSYRERIADRLRLLLYGPVDWQRGRLATEIANLQSLALSLGQAFVSVTPNYDDYLFQALQEAGLEVDLLTSTRGESDVEPGDPVLAANPVPATWLEDPDSVLYGQSASLVQLHGLIPHSRSVNNGEVITPVIDELDYIKTEPHSSAALEALFRDRAVLLVGTSFTDRPLLQALAATKPVDRNDDYPASPPRYVLIDTGAKYGEDEVAQQSIRRNSIQRFESVGVTPVYIDFYSQASQFIAEIAEYVREVSADTDILEDERANAGERIDAAGELSLPNGYGARLVKWSEAWTGTEVFGGPRSEQIYALLDLLQRTVRNDLDVSASEILKTELWVRDDPIGFRGLTLWSSTASVYMQRSSARRSPFEYGSKISATRAFLEGRPIIWESSGGVSFHQRWHTFLAVPITLNDEESDGLGTLPVAAIVVASIRVMKKSGLNRPSRRDMMKKAVEHIHEFGVAITRTSFPAD